MRENLKNAKDGDKIAMEIIIKEFEPLLKKVSISYYIKYHDKNDIMQIATLALIKAVKNFDEEKSDNFTSYAKKSINNTLIREIQKSENKYYTQKINFEIEEIFNIEEIQSREIDIKDELINKETNETLRKLINSLKEEEKAIIKAIYINEIKIKEYAEENNIPYNNLVYKKNKILNKLKEEYIKLV